MLLKYTKTKAWFLSFFGFEGGVFAEKFIVPIWSSAWERALGWWFQGEVQAEARHQGDAEGPFEGLWAP